MTSDAEASQRAAITNESGRLIGIFLARASQRARRDRGYDLLELVQMLLSTALQTHATMSRLRRALDGVA